MGLEFRSISLLILIPWLHITMGGKGVADSVYIASNINQHIFKPLESYPKHPQSPRNLEYPSPAVDPRHLRPELRFQSTF